MRPSRCWGSGALPIGAGEPATISGSSRRPAVTAAPDAATPEGAGSPAGAGEDYPSGFDLTRREREILRLLVHRLTDPEIATQLFISPKTASNHVSNVLAKLGATNRREAAA